MSDREKRYFWLRLKRDFFKRHDIRIIEDMEHGRDYILFYMKLLCESVDHDGKLRFSDEIPYNEKMLATITHTDEKIVHSALNVFSELRMMELYEDGTYFMNEVPNMIGSETYWAEQKRMQRINAGQAVDNVQNMSGQNVNCPSKSKSKSKSKNKESVSAPPEQKHTHGTYKHVKIKDSEVEKLKAEFGDQITEECITFLDEYIEMKGYKAANHYLCIRKWVVDAVRERRAKRAGYGKKTANNQYAQRDIDFDNLEKRLLAGGE